MSISANNGRGLSLEAPFPPFHVPPPPPSRSRSNTNANQRYGVISRMEWSGDIHGVE